MSSTSGSIHAQRSSFVADGTDRLAEGIRSAVLPEIHAAVTAEYSDRLVAAGAWLYWCMNAKIRRRVDAEIANDMPSDDTFAAISWYESIGFLYLDPGEASGEYHRMYIHLPEQKPSE